MDILFYKEDIDFHWKQEEQLRSLVVNIIHHESETGPGNISIIFCSDEYLLGINRQYLDHDYYTDIITFPYTSNPLTADLYISIDRVIENANQLDQKFDTELCRVVIHGILHLCGYGDTTSSEIKTMRSKEDHYLKDLLQLTDWQI